MGMKRATQVRQDQRAYERWQSEEREERELTPAEKKQVALKARVAFRDLRRVVREEFYAKRTQDPNERALKNEQAKERMRRMRERRRSA